MVPDRKHIKEEPYKVPDGYFDGLYLSILENKSEVKPGKGWMTILLHSNSFRISALSLVVIIVSAWFIFQWNGTSEADCVSLACVEESELVIEAVEIDAADLMEYASATLSDSTSNIETNLEEFDESQLLNEL